MQKNHLRVVASLQSHDDGHFPIELVQHILEILRT